MGLTSKQKEYLRKNAFFFTSENLASDLHTDRKNIEQYLKKIWSREKYKKYISKGKSDNVPKIQESDFVFREFFQKNLFVFIGLFLLVLIAYFNSLGNGFVSDDIPAIPNNENLGDLSSAFSNFILGWPRNIAYFIIYKIFGNSAPIFRGLNIFFHLGSTFLVFTLLSIISKRNVALLASLIFAVHPILVESVTWISGGTYPQYSFFLLLSFLAYLTSKGKFKFWGVAWFFLAVFSSEKAIVFPFILIAFELSFGQLKSVWKKLAPYFLVEFLSILFLLFKLIPKINNLETVSYQTTGTYNPFLQIPISISSYLKLIFWPQKLSLYQTDMTFTLFQYALMLVVFSLFIALVIIGWKKNKALFFWLAFFVITLLPTLSPLGISWIVAERYVYLGSLGIFVVVAMSFNWIFEKIKEKNDFYKYALTAVFALIILSLSVRTIVRNMDWKSEDTLWIATAKVSSSGQTIHNNLGDVYGRQGNLERAAEEFKKAIEINPRYADAYHNLGNTYRDMGRLDLAEENYQKALEFNPNLWQSYQNLAIIYFNRGDYQKSLEHMQKALTINPQNKNLQENLQVIRAKIAE